MKDEESKPNHCLSLLSFIIHTSPLMMQLAEAVNNNMTGMHTEMLMLLFNI